MGKLHNNPLSCDTYNMLFATFDVQSFLCTDSRKVHSQVMGYYFLMHILWLVVPVVPAGVQLQTTTIDNHECVYLKWSGVFNVHRQLTISKMSHLSTEKSFIKQVLQEHTPCAPAGHCITLKHSLYLQKSVET